MVGTGDFSRKVVVLNPGHVKEVAKWIHSGRPLKKSYIVCESQVRQKFIKSSLSNSDITIVIITHIQTMSLWIVSFYTVPKTPIVRACHKKRTEYVFLRRRRHFHII